MKRLIFIIFMATGFCTVGANASGDVSAGKEKSQTCVACHGDNGVSPNPLFPTIAGQYKDYLYQSLIDYKSGKRKNAVMSGIVAALNDQDMRDLAAYYASLDGLFAMDLPDEK